MTGCSSGAFRGSKVERRTRRQPIAGLLRRDAVGECGKDRVGRGHGRIDRQGGPGEVGVDRRDRNLVAIPADEADDLDVRMAGQQTNELRADEPRRADDRDADEPIGARAVNLRGLISRPATCLWSGDLDPRAHRRVALLAGSGFRVVTPERIADMGV